MSSDLGKIRPLNYLQIIKDPKAIAMNSSTNPNLK